MTINIIFLFSMSVERNSDEDAVFILDLFQSGNVTNSLFPLNPTKLIVFKITLPHSFALNSLLLCL